MTTAEKLLKRCEFDSEYVWGEDENARLLPIIIALIEACERHGVDLSKILAELK